MKNIFMWPQVNINTSTVSYDERVLAEIEQYFSALYAPYKVVYFSRARVAMMAISATEKLTRAQLTFVQPFSSHCVLSAVSHLSTPTTMQPQKSQQQIIYHQWGHKTLADSTTYQNILIEDAVDSLILSNEHNQLFPNNAPFCLISLPKICEVAIGAIVICQNEADYQKLLVERDMMKNDIGSAIDSIDIPVLQEPILQASPTLVPVLKDSMKTIIESTSKKLQSNIAYISRLYPKLSLANNLLTKRLPSNIIVTQAQYDEEELYEKVPFVVIEKQRTFFDYQRQSCEKVWLLPCHSQAEWFNT